MSETDHDFASHFDYVLVFPMNKGKIAGNKDVSKDHHPM